MIKRCVICKQLFEHENPKKKSCTRVKCRIKLSYHILRQKGYDPEIYYYQLIKSNYKVKCKFCGCDMCARFVRDFFYPICKKCEDEEKEVFWPCVDEFNKDAIEEACGLILPSSLIETVKNTWDESKCSDANI